MSVSFFPPLGRTTETVADYTGAMYETGDSDVATEYTYDGDNNVLTVTADEPSSGYQETEYVYGVTTSGGSTIDSNDLLAAVEYPNASTGAPSSSSEDAYIQHTTSARYVRRPTATATRTPTRMTCWAG